MKREERPAGPPANPQPNGPLRGIKVVELATVIAGPTAGQILADFGADVIKIEHPDGGDNLRRIGDSRDGQSLWWKAIGRNKRSVGLYVGDPAAAQALLRLLDSADVMIESFRPGTLEKWDLGWERLSQRNPRLILARVSGFGQDGPYAGRPVFGTLIEAMSGLAALTGDPDGPPTLPPVPIADYMAGYAAAIAILMALYHRDAHGGVGQVIDVSVMESVLSLMALPIIRSTTLGVHDRRAGSRMATTAPRNVFRTADGKWVAVSGSTPGTAAAIMACAGRADLADQPWFRSGAARYERADELEAEIASWMAAHTRDEVLKAAVDVGATVAPVNDIDELLCDPQVRQRGMICTVPDDELGSVAMTAPLFRMSATPGAVRWCGPALGDATEEVLTGEARLTPAELAELIARGIAR